MSSNNKQLDKYACKIAEIDAALCNGADEALWPPGKSRAEAIEHLKCMLVEAQNLIDNLQSRIHELPELEAEVLMPEVKSRKIPIEGVVDLENTLVTSFAILPFSNVEILECEDAKLTVEDNGTAFTYKIPLVGIQGGNLNSKMETIKEMNEGMFEAKEKLSE